MNIGISRSITLGFSYSALLFLREFMIEISEGIVVMINVGYACRCRSAPCICDSFPSLTYALMVINYFYSRWVTIYRSVPDVSIQMSESMLASATPNCSRSISKSCKNSALQLHDSTSSPFGHHASLTNPSFWTVQIVTVRVSNREMGGMQPLGLCAHTIDD